MPFLIGRISLQAEVPSRNGFMELCPRPISNYTEPKDRVKFQTILANTYGGVAADYFFKDFTKLSISAQKRIRDGDAFELVWKSDKITGVDFDLEDGKLIIKVVDKDTGLEEVKFATGVGVNVRVSLFESDGVTSLFLTSTEYIMVDTPIGGGAFVKLDFVNGVAEPTFNPPMFGAYRMPADPIRTFIDAEYRVVKSLKMEACI